MRRHQIVSMYRVVFASNIDFSHVKNFFRNISAENHFTLHVRLQNYGVINFVPFFGPPCRLNPVNIESMISTDVCFLTKLVKLYECISRIAL